MAYQPSASGKRLLPSNYNFGTGAAQAFGSHTAGIENLPRANLSPSRTPTVDTAESRAARTQAIVEKQLEDFRKAHKLPSKAERDKADRKAANKAPKGATLHANQPSECFVSLSWKDGVATAEFYRGGALVYDYDMSKGEFLDWALSDSLGSYFNDVIRE